VTAAPCFSRMRAIRPRGAIADFLQVHFNGEAKGQQHTDVIGRQWIYLRTPRMKPERPEGTVALIGTPPNHRTAAMLGARGLRRAVGAASARRAMSTACVPVHS